MPTSARSRQWTRRAGVLAVAAVAIVSLSACIKVDSTFTINADATASGTLALEFQKEAAGFLGISSLDDFSSNVTSEDMAGSDLKGLGDCTPSETDVAYVYTCTFTDTAFTDGEGPWTITKDGNSIVMTVVNEAQTDNNNLLGDAGFGTISIDATFPGPITSVTGAGATQTSDTTVAVSAKLTDAVDVEVRSDTSTSALSGLAGKFAVILAVLLGIAVIVLVIVAAVVLMRRRKSAAALEAGNAEPAALETGVIAGEVVAAETAPQEVPPAETSAGPDGPETPGTPEDGPETPGTPEDGPETSGPPEDGPAQPTG